MAAVGIDLGLPAQIFFEPTIKTIELLERELKGKKCLEVGAGMGMLCLTRIKKETSQLKPA